VWCNQIVDGCLKSLSALGKPFKSRAGPGQSERTMGQQQKSAQNGCMER